MKQQTIIRVQRPKKQPAYIKELQQRIQEMRDNGTFDRAAKLYSMSYLTFSQANCYNEQANDILKQYNMVQGKIKTAVNNLMQSFDAYNKVMSSLIGDNKAALNQLCFDSDTLNDMLDAFMLNNIEVERGPYYKAKLFLPSKKTTKL